MAGTRIRGIHVGADADAAVFSFQAVKNLPTADSGMICFKESKFDERARKLSWLGIDKDTFSRTHSKGDYKWLYEVEELGYKYHGNSIMAAMALVSLKYLESDNEYRRSLAAWYTEELATNPKVKIIEHSMPEESSRHLFQIAVENRNDVMAKLNNSGIFPGVHYRDNSEYSLYRSVVGDCPIARELSSQIISLPMHLGVTKDDVREIADIIST
jgi:dTDP-4-amino-4,6-dideoxygalactose transaminase